MMSSNIFAEYLIISLIKYVKYVWIKNNLSG